MLLSPHTAAAALLTLTIALSACGQTPPAAAQTPDATTTAKAPDGKTIFDRLAASTDFDGDLAKLTDAERAALKPYTEVAQTGESEVPTINALVAGCWTATSSAWANNVLGKRLYTLYQRQNWCSNGSSLTSASTDRWYTVSWIGWRFVNWVERSSTGGRGHTYYRSVTQAHFALGSGGWDIQNHYPRIERTIYR
ncbi:hypothetical protein [Deinococcus sp.]|uniref:hypothetical protein n=1 Tax=Deinococcus sp. TaxID=47478 RepID=UPI002869BB5C|nr:hypothetical protein [Deinococcus sp.]